MKTRLDRPPRRERGVVLVIALVMLVVISMLATFSIRNSTSSEAIAGNVRTAQMAQQAAEIALRYCEDTVVDFFRNGTPLPAGFNVHVAATPLASQEPDNWDKVLNADPAMRELVLVPEELVTNADMGTTFKRVPECMVETIPTVNTASTALTYSRTFVVTARGFGPEVAAANAARSRPEGSEVWLQSTLELE
jgi:type IV pilus assembly protein PilX